jgi:hypothetical protein
VYCHGALSRVIFMPPGTFAVTSAKYVSSASRPCGCPRSTWPANVTTPDSLRNKTKLPYYGCCRAPGRTVPFTPAHIVVDQRGEFPFVEIGPPPRNGGHRVAGRALRQKERRVVALPISTMEPEFRCYTEIPATATSVRPPQVTMRVVLFSRRSHHLRLAVLVDHDCFHRVQVIRIVGPTTTLIRSSNQPKGCRSRERSICQPIRPI